MNTSCSQSSSCPFAMSELARIFYACVTSPWVFLSSGCDLGVCKLSGWEGQKSTFLAGALK